MKLLVSRESHCVGIHITYASTNTKWINVFFYSVSWGKPLDEVQVQWGNDAPKPPCTQCRYMSGSQHVRRGSVKYFYQFYKIRSYFERVWESLRTTTLAFPWIYVWKKTHTHTYIYIVRIKQMMVQVSIHRIIYTYVYTSPITTEWNASWKLCAIEASTYLIVFTIQTRYWN